MNEQHAVSETTQHIPLAQIVPGDNDRKRFDPDALADLADNIAAHGLAQPITLRPVGEGYRIVAGERRWRAFKLLAERDPMAYTAIPALVRDYTDEEADAIMLAENVQRADLDPIDEANAYKKRMDKYGWSAAECAAHASVSPGRVRDRLSLLNLIPDAQHLVRYGNIPLKHATMMGKHLTANYQRVAFKVLQKPKLVSAEEFEKIVGELARDQDQLSMFDMDALLQAPSQDVYEQLTASHPEQSFVHFEHNGCTITVLIQHPKGQQPRVDIAQLKKGIV